MISVFSSFATDIITYENNRKIPGGPALWIENALRDLWAEYEMKTGKSGDVIIEKDENNQDRWTIRSVHEIPFEEPSKDGIVCVSTLKDEFPLHVIEKLENTLFLDIQWFLRQDSGWKKRFDCRKLVSRGPIFVKATQEEFLYLDHYADVACTFIITNGGDPIKILDRHREESIHVESWIFEDTIGAGDTFLSGLCYYFSQEYSLRDAVIEAGKYTYTFLEKKNTTSL